MDQGFEDPDRVAWAPGTRLEGYVESLGDGRIEAVFAEERDGPRWAVGFPASWLGEGAEYRIGTYLEAVFTGSGLKVRVADVGRWTQAELDAARRRAEMLARELRWDDDGPQGAR